MPAAYVDTQVNAAKQLVRLTKYAKLCQLAANSNPTDPDAAGASRQARNWLIGFVAEYGALEVYKRSDVNIFPLAREIQQHLIDIGTVLERRLPAGEQNASTRHAALERASQLAAHGSGQFDNRWPDLLSAAQGGLLPAQGMDHVLVRRTRATL